MDPRHIEDLADAMKLERDWTERLAIAQSLRPGVRSDLAIRSAQHELDLARDRLDTTSLGHGFAVPHARTDHVQQIVLAIGRSDAGVQFEGGELIRVMFMLGTPKARPGDYLLVLSTLCRLLKDAANRDAFLGASTPEEFMRVLIEAETKLLGPA